MNKLLLLLCTILSLSSAKSAYGQNVVAVDACHAMTFPPIYMQEPRFMCANQSDRYFVINGAQPGFTYYWQFFRVNSDGSYTQVRPFNASCTAADPRVLVHGYQWGPGIYKYQVKECGPHPYSGAICCSPYLKSDDVAGDMTVEDDCGYDPQDDNPQFRQAAVVGEQPRFTGKTDNRSEVAYPNPVSTILTIHQSFRGAVLLDKDGRIVQKANKYGQLNVEDLPEGLYNLRTQRANKTLNQRIQVKH